MPLNNPVYDVERFGLKFVASPRHADVLLVTGPVTWNMREALLRTYNAAPMPKWVGGAGRLRCRLRRLRRFACRGRCRWPRSCRCDLHVPRMPAAAARDRERPAGAARSAWMSEPPTQPIKLLLSAFALRTWGRAHRSRRRARRSQVARDRGGAHWWPDGPPASPTSPSRRAKSPASRAECQSDTGVTGLRRGRAQVAEAAMAADPSPPVPSGRSIANCAAAASRSRLPRAPRR